jgi:hypothetical protein
VNDPIFIVGPHRGGSTLWHNLIAMCPGMLRLAEPRFLGAPRQKDFNFFLRTQVGDLSHDTNVLRMVELCFSKNTVPGLEGHFWRFLKNPVVDSSQFREKVVERIKMSDRGIGAIARIILEELTAFSGCTRACVKFPVDIRHLAPLLRWFPNCRIVHITRDPRALAMSKYNDPSGTALRIKQYPQLAWAIRRAVLLLVISQYRLSARVHQQFKCIANYRLFRYEDLLAEPERVLAELCEFTGIPFQEEMLEPQKGEHEHQPSSLTGKQQKAFDVTAAVRWRAVISPLDNLVTLALTRTSMGRLRYDPENHPIFRHQENFNRPCLKF